MGAGTWPKWQHFETMVETIAFVGIRRGINSNPGFYFVSWLKP